MKRSAFPLLLACWTALFLATSNCSSVTKSSRIGSMMEVKGGGRRRSDVVGSFGGGQLRRRLLRRLGQLRRSSPPLATNSHSQFCARCTANVATISAESFNSFNADRSK